jgi:SAM-dependent methyltransferase
MRDTDADWKAIGAAEPFWGVITAPQFKRKNLDSDCLASFYACGVEHIVSVTSRLERAAAKPIHVSRALDFGCGTGRLSEAMTKYADEVIGFDISPNMLTEARRYSKGGVHYCDQIPDGKFGWINSFIVFQHVPPKRGLKLFEELLQKLDHGGFISLHFTIYRDLAADPPERFGEAPVSMLRKWAHAMLRKSAIGKAVRRIWWGSAPRGTMLMFDYDLNRICALCHRYGIEELTLVHTNHGGCHGVEVYGCSGA